MRATTDDVLTGSAAVLMAVALFGMVLTLGTGAIPGVFLAMVTLGSVGVAAGVVRRFERGAAQQPSPAQSLLQARQRRAELAPRAPADDAVPSAA